MNNLLAAATPPPTIQFAFGWFDLVVLILLVVGFFRGRKHGMSQEILFLLQWLLIVVVAGQYYEPLSKMLYEQGLFGPLACNLMVYIAVVLVIKLIFTNLKKAIGEKIFGSDVFGKYEFYLGMVAGILRYACITLFIISLANASAFSQQEINERRKKQVAELGSSYFPSIPEVQDQVLNASFTGRLVKEHLSRILLKPASPTEDAKKKEGPAKRRESMIDEVIEGGKTPKK
ncbi:MAG: Colicin production protein [Verrucomicrobiales bacterium]|nr:Colicin production protein [Verrucomicrobiales bacterium]